MFRPASFFIGLRYVWSRRKDGFISFTSLISVCGIALGITALITAVSVMNGFAQEVKKRILSVNPHIIIYQDGNQKTWEMLEKRLLTDPDVLSVAPIIEETAILTGASEVGGVLIRAIDPHANKATGILSEHMLAGSLTDLKAGTYRIILGRDLAKKLSLDVGDNVRVIVPQSSITPVGVIPTLKRFTVSGIFSVNMSDYDSVLSFIHLDDGLRLFRKNNYSGRAIKLQDPTKAPLIRERIEQDFDSQNLLVFDWTQRQSALFSAMRTEKRITAIVLSMIVIVAAFNILSALMMLVHNKRSDIAILRTLGCSSRNIVTIFLLQGCCIGFLGVCIGSIIGIALALNIETLVPWIEQLLGMQLMSSDIYFIDYVPSNLSWMDVSIIAISALALCFVSTIYPAIKASKTNPIKALRYE